MNKKNGKIICVVGAPRSGKSFLVKKLAEHYKAEAFYEGENVDFPDRIKEDIAKNIRPLERIIWFRNKLTRQYREALLIKSNGGIVVSDIGYFAVDLYTDVITSDLFERSILHDLAKTDEETLGLPDIIIHLVSNEAKTKEFIKIGGREFDAGENYYNETVVPIQKAWSKYFSDKKHNKHFIEIRRDNLDFSKKTDLDILIKLIG